MPSPRRPLASPCRGWVVLLLVPALLLLSSAAHRSAPRPPARLDPLAPLPVTLPPDRTLAFPCSAEESTRVLRVGKELVGETMPLRHGQRVYRVDGLRPSAWYEVKISYPASV